MANAEAFFLYKNEWEEWGRLMLKINSGEVILDPFWDPKISTHSYWKVHKERAKGMTLKSNWCDVAYSYIAPGKDNVCFMMSRNYENQLIEEFDFLICSIGAPVGAKVLIQADTDKGRWEKISNVFGEIKQEIRVDIQEATYLETVTIQVISEESGPGYGYIQWIGLENYQNLQAHLKQFTYSVDDLELYIMPEEYEPTYTMRYELIMSHQELEELRLIHNTDMKEKNKSVYEDYIKDYVDVSPENYISEYVNFWTDRRFSRERDFHKALTQKIPTLAVAGSIKKDKSLLRKAARYAISIALCTYWNDAFITQTKGSDWEHRGFVKSIVGYELGIVLDLAGEMFTDEGRELILRRLAEETLGSINFVTWKHDYIFHNNQLAWFSHGRMMAYAILEQHYKHVCPYTDIAYQELVESIENIIYDDGGYGEGPSYMNCIGRNAMFAFYVYARMRKLQLTEIVPEKLKKTGDFIEALSSTVESQDAIPVCDGRPVFEVPTVMYMANLLPESYWMDILNKVLQRDTRIPEDFLSFYFYSRLERKKGTTRSFIHLKDMGMVASTREINEEIVKILVFGNKENADHAHEDKGSFVIEFCNETFAMDAGNADYASSVSYLVKLAKYHNLGVPIGNFKEEPGPERPNTRDVFVHGEGDEKSLSATVDLSYTWRNYFNHYSRSFYSNDPSQLIIEDSYELISGDGLDFGWNTMLPVYIHNQEVTIAGERGIIKIEVEEDVAISMEALPYFDGEKLTRISFQKKGIKGKIILKCNFIVEKMER